VSLPPLGSGAQARFLILIVIFPFFVFFIKKRHELASKNTCKGALASGLPNFLAFSQHPLNTLVQTGGPIVCIFTDFAVVTFAILDPKLVIIALLDESIVISEGLQKFAGVVAEDIAPTLLKLSELGLQDEIDAVLETNAEYLNNAFHNPSDL
jgi:hypothetical protein